MHHQENDSEAIKRLQEMLFKAGTELGENPLHTRTLRNLQRELEFIQFKTQDKRLNFLLFFITLIINDIYYNLVGDIIGTDSERVTKVRKAVFKYMGKSLIDLSEFLKSGQLDDLHTVYYRLVQEYLQQVSKLNRDLI